MEITISLRFEEKESYTHIDQRVYFYQCDRLFQVAFIYLESNFAEETKKMECVTDVQRESITWILTNFDSVLGLNLPEKSDW